MPEKKTVGRELVEKAGIDMKTLLDLLVRNASAELTTFYYYTILRVNLIGLEGEGLKQIAEDARIEDRNHFEALVPGFTSWAGSCPTIWWNSTIFPRARQQNSLPTQGT
jgi:ferritin-like protein